MNSLDRKTRVGRTHEIISDKYSAVDGTVLDDTYVEEKTQDQRGWSSLQWNSKSGLVSKGFIEKVEVILGLEGRLRFLEAKAALGEGLKWTCVHRAS